jgi:hypothetical protein
MNSPIYYSPQDDYCRLHNPPFLTMLHILHQSTTLYDEDDDDGGGDDARETYDQSVSLRIVCA